MQNNTNNQVYAGFFVRLAAYLIDWVIVGAALLVIRIPIWIASFSGSAEFVLKDFIFQYSIYDIVLYVLKVAYFVLLTYYTGSTLGKKLLQIRVISVEDRKPTFFEIVFRESVGKFLSALIIYVGYIMIGADKKKRGLHDMLSDTYVVYYHQKNVAVPTPITYHRVQYAAPVATMPPYQQPNRPISQAPNQFVQNPASNQPMQQVLNQAVKQMPDQLVQNQEMKQQAQQTQVDQSDSIKPISNNSEQQIELTKAQNQVMSEVQTESSDIEEKSSSTFLKNE